MRKKLTQDVSQLELGEECRAIQGEIRAAKFRDDVRLQSRWAVRPDDLLQALNEDAPRVLHFSGHGSGEQGLYFQSEDGGAAMVTADGLAQVVQAAGASVKLVVLNACYSEVQAKAIAAHIPCVIGMTAAIGDRAATVYAASLYRALAFGRSVGNAHQQGLAALALQATAGRVRDIAAVKRAPVPPTPTLLTRPDVNANRVYIVRPARLRPRRWPAIALALLFLGAAGATATAVHIIPSVPADVPMDAGAHGTNRVHWSLRSTPPGAQVCDEQGHLLGITPWDVDRARGSGSVDVVLKLPGHAEKKLTLDGTLDVVRDEVLVPLTNNQVPIFE